MDLAPNRLAWALEARARAGRTHVDLTVSNPTSAELPYDRERLSSALADPRALVYEPSAFGLPEARMAVAELWQRRGVSVDPGRVALSASTSEAYSFLWKLLCDPGDAVLVPQPSYPLFEHLARYEGVEVVPYPLVYDGAWHIDLPALRARVTPRTRAVVVVSPNNPTGSFLKQDELRGVAELGLPIVSDEVFGEYGFGADSARATSALQATDALVFALDGLSKLAALPQYKLAWITVGGPEALVREALSGLELVLDTFLSPSGPVQHALPALVQASVATRDAIRARLCANLACLRDGVAESAVTPLAVEGGWYAVLRLPRVHTEEEWTLGLLDESDVLVQPGWFYDFADEPYWVVSLLTPETALRTGVERLAEYVARRG